MSLVEEAYPVYQPVKKGVTFTPDAYDNIELPENQNISQIVITADLSADVGAINPNTFLKWIKLELEGQSIHEWTGEVPDDQVPTGIANLRVLNAVLNGIEDEDNVIIIDLTKFGPLPAGAKKNLIFQTNTVANIAADATATTVTGTLSFYYLSEEPDELWLSTIVRREKIEIGSTATKTHRPIQCPAGYACSFALLRIDDGGTLSDSSITNILIKKDNKILVNVEYKLLKNQIQTISKYSLPTGFLVLDLNELQWSANELEFEFSNSGSDTTININYVFTKPVE